MTEPASTVASCSGTTKEEKSPPPFLETAIGIDIGTSPCSVSVWNGSQVEILKYSIDEMIKRSCETFKDDGSSIGVSSEVTVSNEHGASIFKTKRLIEVVDSDLADHASTNFPFLMDNLDIKVRPFIAAFVNRMRRSTTAVELLGSVLLELKEMVETQMKRHIRNVVFTVPVSLSRLQLKWIHRACAMAGLKVIRLMPQPTAVALWYAQQQLQVSASASSDEDTDNESKKNALIFNLDAGYCDVAVIAPTANGKCQIKALTGSAIGGEDLIGNLMRHLLPDSENIFKKHVHEYGEIAAMDLFRSSIEDVITQLSSATSFEVNFDLGYGLKICKVVTREEFEEVNKEVFKKCERIIMQCLEDADLKVENIKDVIIVGGCCDIPKVKYLVTEICKRKEFCEGVKSLDAALHGAAMAGAIALGFDNPFGNLELLDFPFTPLAIGIKANGNNFVPVIPRNTFVPLPIMRRVVFTTIHDKQTAALIAVYEGESLKAEENHLLGYFKITEIPEASKGVPKIYVNMDIDHENRLTVIGTNGMPGSQQSPIPVIIARVTKFTDEHIGLIDDESLIRTYGDTMDLVTLVNKE